MKPWPKFVSGIKSVWQKRQNKMPAPPMRQAIGILMIVVGLFIASAGVVRLWQTAPDIAMGAACLWIKLATNDGC